MRVDLVLVCFLAVSPALAQEQDVTLGRRIADADCKSCHAINRGETSVSSRGNGPSFQSIADMSSANRLSLGVFLRSSHGGMPNLILDDSEADQVIAYILSLKGS